MVFTWFTCCYYCTRASSFVIIVNAIFYLDSDSDSEPSEEQTLSQAEPRMQAPDTQKISHDQTKPVTIETAHDIVVPQTQTVEATHDAALPQVSDQIVTQEVSVSFDQPRSESQDLDKPSVQQQLAISHEQPASVAQEQSISVQTKTTTASSSDQPLVPMADSYLTTDQSVELSVSMPSAQPRQDVSAEADFTPATSDQLPAQSAGRVQSTPEQAQTAVSEQTLATDSVIGR